MKIIYGCQQIARDPETQRLIHLPPILVREGESVDHCRMLVIRGPSEIVTNRDDPPAEVKVCKDHSHTIWLQTEAPVDPSPGSVKVADARRIYICGTVAKAPPGTYKQAAIVYDSDDGQKCAKHLRLLGESRIVFAEHDEIIGYCPCKVRHPHRMWIETYGEIEVVE